MTPRRIQRKRTKGWKMPEGSVYVGRPTKWGNPFPYPKEWAAAMFLEFMDNGGSNYPSKHEIRTELRGKDLACWCSLDQPCHADVLLEIANQPAAEIGTPEGEVYPDWGHEPGSQGNSEEAAFKKAMSTPLEVWHRPYRGKTHGS